MADSPQVGTWLNRLRDSMGYGARASASARHALHTAQRMHCKVELIALHGTTTGPRAMITTIEEVAEDSFVVGLPVMSGRVRQLLPFGLYGISFNGPGGRLAGQARNLGRTKIRTLTGQTIPGYRLELPAVLHTEERRSELRALLGPDLTREGQLQMPGRPGVVWGQIEDLSGSGVRIRCRNASDAIERGATGLFKIDLPAPLGELNESVTVVGVETDPTTGVVRLRLRFVRPNEHIARAMGGREAG